MRAYPWYLPRYLIWKTHIRYDPDIRYLEPWTTILLIRVPSHMMHALTTAFDLFQPILLDPSRHAFWPLLWFYIAIGPKIFPHPCISTGLLSSLSSTMISRNPRVPLNNQCIHVCFFFDRRRLTFNF